MVFGRVYCIRSHQTTDIYIGSTTQILCRRMTDHRNQYKIKRRNITSFEILKFEDAYIELIEEGEFESKQALQKREGELIRTMNCVNKRVAGRTEQEHYQEVGKELKKQYRLDHKDEIYEQRKQYRLKHKDEIKEKKRKDYLKKKTIE